MELQPIHISITLNITPINVNPVYSGLLIVVMRSFMVPNVSIMFIFHLASVPQTDRAVPIIAVMLYFITCHV